MKSQLLTAPGKEPTTLFFSSISSAGTTPDSFQLFRVDSSFVFPRRIARATSLRGKDCAGNVVI